MSYETFMLRQSKKFSEAMREMNGMKEVKETAPQKPYICQKKKVAPYSCSRKANFARVTSNNRIVWLCKKCDEEFGDTVGLKA